MPKFTVGVDRWSHHLQNDWSFKKELNFSGFTVVYFYLILTSSEHLICRYFINLKYSSMLARNGLQITAFLTLSDLRTALSKLRLSLHRNQTFNIYYICHWVDRLDLQDNNFVGTNLKDVEASVIFNSQGPTQMSDTPTGKVIFWFSSHSRGFGSKMNSNVWLCWLLLRSYNKT